jgi:hypothetical protein
MPCDATGLPCMVCMERRVSAAVARGGGGGHVPCTHFPLTMESVFDSRDPC